MIHFYDGPTETQPLCGKRAANDDGWGADCKRCKSLTKARLKAYYKRLAKRTEYRWVILFKDGATQRGTAQSFQAAQEQLTAWHGDGELRRVTRFAIYPTAVFGNEGAGCTLTTEDIDEMKKENDSK